MTGFVGEFEDGAPDPMGRVNEEPGPARDGCVAGRASILTAPDLKAIMFDIDGTLVDTTYLHTVAWAQAMRQFGHRVPMRDIHRGIGMGSDHLMDALLPEGRDRYEDAAMVASHAALLAIHRTNFDELPGARRLLSAVKHRGLGVLLASSASGAELHALLKALGNPQHIDLVATADDAARSKPDPDILRNALTRAGLSAADVVFVGDSVWDVEASSTLGIGCVGVTCGGTSAQELLDAGACEVYLNPGHLADMAFSVR